MYKPMYHAISGRRLLRLSHEDIDPLNSDRADLQQALAEVGYASRVDTQQIKDSIRVGSPDSSAEFANTRLYIAGVASGPLIVKKMIEYGATFKGAKIFMPDLHTRPQTFRLDTPIIDVQNRQQLRSSVTALRQISMEGELIRNVPTHFGQKINELPGVYLAQREGTQSFNNNMSKLFGPALQQAAEKVKLQAGDTLTDDVVLSIASETRKVAQQQTGRFNHNNGNHAFMAGQDVIGILDIINS